MTTIKLRAKGGTRKLQAGQMTRRNRKIRDIIVNVLCDLHAKANNDQWEKLPMVFLATSADLAVLLKGSNVSWNRLQNEWLSDAYRIFQGTKGAYSSKGGIAR